MTNILVTTYLRDLAERLMMISGSCGVDDTDVKQLLDLADTLDEERAGRLLRSTSANDQVP